MLVSTPPFSPAKCWWSLLMVKSHQNISNHRMIIGWSYVDCHGIRFPIWLNSNPMIMLWFSIINPLKTKNWSSVAIVILLTTCYNHHKQNKKKTFTEIVTTIGFFTTNKVLRTDHPQTVDSLTEQQRNDDAEPSELRDIFAARTAVSVVSLWISLGERSGFWMAYNVRPPQWWECWLTKTPWI